MFFNVPAVCQEETNECNLKQAMNEARMADVQKWSRVNLLQDGLTMSYVDICEISPATCGSHPGLKMNGMGWG
jgi:hypothetical protein